MVCGIVFVGLCLGLFVPDGRAVPQESRGTLEKRREEAFQEGRRLYFLGDFEAAKQKFREAVLLHRKAHGYPDILSLKYEGLCYQYQDDLDQALALFHEALQEEERLKPPYPSGVADALNNIGWVLYLKGDYTHALEQLKKALAVAKDEPIPGGPVWLKGRILTNIGAVYSALGNYVMAFKYLQDVLEWGKFHNDKMNQTRALQQLGNLERSWGNLARALECYEEAVRVGREAYDQLYNRAYLVEALNDLATLYAQLRRYDQAHAAFQEALAISHRLSTRRLIGQCLNNLGNLFRDQGKIPEALSYHREAWQMSREAGLIPMMAMALGELGVDYLRSERYQDAVAYLNRALEVGGPSMTAELKARVYLGLAEAHEKLGEWQKALEYYRLAIESIEQVRLGALTEDRKIGFWQTKQATFEQAISLLHRLHEKDPQSGYDAQAFAYAERGRARAFLDMLTEARVNVQQGLSPQVLEEERAISREMIRLNKALLREGLSRTERAKLEKDFAGVEERVREFRQRLRLTYPAYADLHSPEPFDLQRVRREVLDERTLLIEFLVGEEKSFLWAISKNESRMVTLPGRAEIERQVKRYRQVITSPPSNGESFNRYFSLARRLYRVLLEPIEKTLKPYDHLIIVPDGILHYLPFETLVARPVTRKTVQPRFLVSSHRISYASSASVLGLLRAGRAESDGKDTRWLAYADPVFRNHRTGAENAERGRGGDAGTRGDCHVSVSPAHRVTKSQRPLRLSGETRLVDVTRSLYRRRGMSLDPLPYSREEVKSIAALYPKTATKLYVAQEATESSVKREKLERYNQLHFATHALIDEEVPARSGVVLSLIGEEEEDGILQMGEVFNLRLKADMVVLSACQSGLGKLVRGEGLIGLTRAFIYAGASSVVVSLWNVRDRSTAEFMRRFYGHLRAGKSRVEALRQAKLDLLRSDIPAYRHPYYWAAFVLVGRGY